MPLTGVEVEGLDDAELRLRKLAALLLDLRPFWPKVVPLWIQWMGEQFDTQGSFGLGSQWAALSPKYAAWKAIHYPGKPILSADGDLRRAATTPRRKVAPLSLELSIEPYVHGPGRMNRKPRTIFPTWFQEGTERMPARPLVFDLPANLDAELDRVADEYVDEMLRVVGL